MSGIDEQRHDHILPIQFVRGRNWKCRDEEMAYYYLDDKNRESVGYIFRPSLVYDDKSEKYLVEFFTGDDWKDVASIRCPTCGIKAWDKESSDWLLFTKYVMLAKQQKLVKYGSEYQCQE